METKGIAPATPATERRQRTPLAVTRERVLGIAEQMFRQSGVQAVSVDAIAQAAGIKKMTLYRCFPSKEELVMACMDQWEAAFRRIWDQAQDQYPNESARQLLAFFQSIYELVSQPGYSGNVFMHLMTDYTDPEHHICVRVREQRASLRADVRNQLVKAEASDPDQLADTYCLLLEGLFTARVRQRACPQRPRHRRKNASPRLRLPCVPARTAPVPPLVGALHKKRCSL